MQNWPRWKLFVTLFVVVFVSGLLWMYVGTDESLRAAAVSPVYWTFVVVATVASYVGFRRGQRIVRR